MRDESMEKEIYEKIYRLEDSYWWFVGKRLLISKFIPRNRKKILDLGCGTGRMLEYLEEYGQKIYGLDSSREALTYCLRRNLSNNLITGDVHYLPFRNNCFDLIIASDVLEHAKDDFIVLSELFRILQKGGLLLITVPAYSFLWSSHDILHKHYRRYKSSNLRKLITKANFKIEKISYFNFFIFPLVLLFRSFKKISSLRKNQSDYLYTPKFLNRLLVTIYKIESSLIKKLNFPFGVSILCLISKE